MKRRPLKDLDDLMGPERVAKAKQKARQRMEAMLVGEVRKQLGFTQAGVSRAMGISQSALSQMEAQDDMQLSTLGRLVTALGGQLEVTARFGDRAVVLVNSSSKRSGRARAKR